MRDPARIDETLKTLERIWKKYPDTRLCQLIDNATHNCSDLFYVEDELLLKLLIDLERRTDEAMKERKTA